MSNVELPSTPWTTVRVTLEGGRQWVWRTEGEGEPTWRNHGNLRVDKEDLNNVVDFTILAQPPKAYDEAYEQGWDDGWTFAKKADPDETDSGYIIPKHTPAASGGGAEADGDQSERVEFCRNCAKCGMEVWGLRPGGICFKCHDDTPAAEPDRVTLPDPTPPIVWSFADEEPWRPEHITFNGAKYILAQPPKADPAETDARFSNETTAAGILKAAKEAEDRAVKRGRDEALAVVVKALEEIHLHERLADSVKYDDVLRATQIIQSEAGGDGHG